MSTDVDCSIMTESSSPPRTRGSEPEQEKDSGWTRVRFVWIAFHALAMALVSIPVPTNGTQPAYWRRKSVQVELANWTRRLQGLGFETTSENLEKSVRELSAAWTTSRDRILSPLLDYQGLLNTRQGWYMFTGPDRQPRRFVLDVTTKEGKRVPVFELGEGSLAPSLLDPDFAESYRVRKAFSRSAWSPHDRDFEVLCRYFDERLRKASPDIDTTRCTILTRDVRSPQEPEKIRPIAPLASLVIGPDSRAQSSNQRGSR